MGVLEAHSGKTREPGVGNEHKSRESRHGQLLPEGWSSEEAATGAVAAGHLSQAAAPAAPDTHAAGHASHHSPAKDPCLLPGLVPRGTSDRLGQGDVLVS